MENYTIKIADKHHLSFLSENDTHISKEMVKTKIKQKEILIMEVNNTIVGWLRYNFFWDEMPFMSMLYFLHEHRRKGYGKFFVNYWENMLVKRGYNRFLTSTMENEEAQHFYRKLGYTDIGVMNFPSEPLEILLMKDKNRIAVNISVIED